MRRVSAFYIIASRFISPWNELQATHDEMMEIVSLDQCYPTTTFKRQLRLFIFQTMKNFMYMLESSFVLNIFRAMTKGSTLIRFLIQVCISEYIEGDGDVG